MSRQRSVSSNLRASAFRGGGSAYGNRRQELWSPMQQDSFVLATLNYTADNGTAPEVILLTNRHRAP